MKVKIGDKIRHSLFGGEKCVGIVEDIQICRRGFKEGRSVKTADVEKHHGVIDLDNGHWCYFDQIEEIIEPMKTLTEEIGEAYNDYIKEEKKEPQFAYVRIRWNDEENPSEPIETIAISTDELKERDEEILYYSNGLQGLLELTEPGLAADFIITELIKFE